MISQGIDFGYGVYYRLSSHVSGALIEQRWYLYIGNMLSKHYRHRDITNRYLVEGTDSNIIGMPIENKRTC